MGTLNCGLAGESRAPAGRTEPGANRCPLAGMPSPACWVAAQNAPSRPLLLRLWRQHLFVGENFSRQFQLHHPDVRGT